MERISEIASQENQESEAAGGWEEWNAVPRDGPAVFVADAVAWDQGIIHGRWLEIRADRATLHTQLTDLLGREPEEGTWAILDQIGLGPVMAPETMPVADLTTLTEYLTAEAIG